MFGCLATVMPLWYVHLNVQSQQYFDDLYQLWMSGQGPFDDVLEVEEKLKVSGYEAGYPGGRAQGLVDGFSTGFTQGIQLADEVGYYLGFAEYMLDNVCLTDTPSDPQARARRVLLQVIQCISEFHCLQVSSSSYLEQLTKIRTKFKQAASLLKIDPPQQTPKSLMEF